jgi:DNA-binding GntR family transcriptional regulator
MAEAGRDQPDVQLVHDRVREAILRGEIPAGEPMSQLAMSKQLGVSRTPLREALRMLEREGLVIAERNRPVRIAEFSTADIEALYAMRIPMEAIGIRVTVPTLGHDDIAELEALMAKMDAYMRMGDLRRMDAPHADFHARFVAAAGPRLTTTMAQLFDHTARYRFAHGAAAEPDGYEARRAEHRAMLDAAAAGDADLTVACMVAHYRHTSMDVISQIAPDHEPIVLLTAIEMVAPSAAAASDRARGPTAVKSPPSRTAEPAKRR